MGDSKEKVLNVKLQKTTVKLNEKVTVILEISGDYGFVNEAEILINQHRSSNERQIKMEYKKTQKNINYFCSEIDFNNLGIYYFCIKIVINNELKWIKLDARNNKAVITENNLPYWTITVYDNDFEVPNWAKGKIMYHIFVDRFCKSEKYNPPEMQNRTINKWGDTPTWQLDPEEKYCNNDFFMGNLKGIEEKIAYIKDLGVEIIYLSPICMSQSNHRYDVADYEKVDPYLGTNKDLKSLCDTAHRNGIKIIIDAVFNHTGNDSKYFNEYGNYKTAGAFKSEKSKYYNWYKKKQNGEFEYWWGFKNLPVCDEDNSNWQKYIYGENGVIDKWFSLGIDGLRLDVADELTDNFIENIRIAVKRNKKDGFIIGEVWENAITKEKDGNQRKYLLGTGLDTVMNYPFANAILKYVRFGNSKYLVETINEISSQYPNDAKNSLMNSLSTHDITRAITTLSADGIQNNKYNWVWDVPYSRDWQFEHDKIDKENYEKAKKMMKVATTIQYFMPGNPCIYYGDEIGMYGYKDPFNRKCFEWDKIDEDMHKFFVQIGKLRKQNKFLSNAEIKIIQADENLFMFERYNENNNILVAVNRTENEVNINIPDKYKFGKYIFGNEYDDSNLLGYGKLIILS